MTFTKLAYVFTKSFNEIISALDECGFTDTYSEHTDSSNEAELWVELDEEKWVLDCLKNNGFLTQNEVNEIIYNDVDTILFY